MKTIDVKVNPDVQAAMLRAKDEPDNGTAQWLQFAVHGAATNSGAINELAMQLAVTQQMFRDQIGPKKYETLRAKAINTLFPPTEEAKEIERLRAENEKLKSKLAAAELADTLEECGNTDDESSE